ncbi:MULTISPECIES: S26 family signal peptidase [Rhodomicrobium]|uniref:S26 family signal peptidase n=1 Tax=Rhodomicrobium TaxID=1068 RepID=UPI000B4BC64F|nr:MULTISPECIES: S26 family signal peptidase [Rhodomicrobium]
MRPRLILLTTASVVMALIISAATSPRYVLNLSPSVPVGLYRLEGRSLQRGDLAVIHLGEPWRNLAQSRGYLLSKAWLIKPVAALPGDRVCRLGWVITINGSISAVAQSADPMGRFLPKWDGCRSLGQDEMFLLSNTDNSFDGRYFDVTPRSALIAKALPFLILVMHQ